MAAASLVLALVSTQAPAASDQTGPSGSPHQGEPAQQPAGRQKILDELFDRLARAPDELEAKGIAGAIERVWMHSGSDTANLLMGRAVQAMHLKDFGLSQQLLGSVVEIEPDWAEGWNQRATARYLMGDDRGAMQDLAHVLALEPRHFAALAGMGFILRRRGFAKEALRVFRRSFELNPRQSEIAGIVDKLAVDVEGRGI
jgi:tetratricopeptide (TPR) repeat protein